MKWSIVGLIIAGVAAAISATILVASLQAGKQSGGGPPQARVIVKATRDLPRMSVIRGDDVVAEDLPAGSAPKEGLSNASQVVGKVLAADMVKGQAFTRRCFAVEGTGFHLASALPEGLRAVSVSLTTHGGLYGLIYPGSVVDVLVSFRTQGSGGQRGDVISMSLLQAVQVLAVEDRTVASKDRDVRPGSGMGATGRRLQVTLMLGPEQAEALQLAMENGTVSLALRNPLDAGPINRGHTTLSELSRAWSSQVATPSYRPNSDESGSQTIEAQSASASVPEQWETIIIRGASMEKHLMTVEEGS